MVTILAIDDKQDNLISQSNLLKKLIPDCNVITAQSGDEGIEKARVALPDTILLDMRVTESDGFEVCRTLKSGENTKHIPVIMVTASETDPKDHIKGLETGADAFLSQPFDEAEFAVQLRAMLRIKKAEDVSRQEIEKMQARFRQVQKMEAIGTLAGGIAHDFNNILSAIIGYTELALYFDSEATSSRELLEQVLKASNRAKDLVAQILTFSRQSEQELKPVMISLLIKENLRLLRTSLPTTIEIRQNITAKSSTVLADPTQIHQVLMNLCTNASHAMRENGGVLDVSLIPFDLDPNAATHYPDLTPGPYLKLTVSDTGHGMNRAVMEHIFDPFFTTKEPGRGAGMGLSVVHGIVTSYGGTIIPESEPGKGTTFHVFFPRLEKKIPAEAETVSPILTGNECILFVDDEEAITHMGQQMLERLGYEVFARTSSIEALEVFRSQPDKFDLILTDQIMPNMTGENLAKKIMQIRPEIPIVLCTGFTETITPEKARAMGFRELLLKPIVIRDLAEAIRRVLDGKLKEQMDK